MRPGLIVGPGDNTDRFTYWPARADRGGEILAPGSAADPTQFIDVRDLAAFLLHLIELRTYGTFNADAPAGKIDDGRAARHQPARRGHGVDGDVGAGRVPGKAEREPVAGHAGVDSRRKASTPGFGRGSSAKAQAAGLTYRPLQTTAADTLAYWKSLPADRRATPKAGLSPAREAEVLKAWHASLAPPAKPAKKKKKR